jgi:hypothetical protein
MFRAIQIRQHDLRANVLRCQREEKDAEQQFRVSLIFLDITMKFSWTYE